MDKTSLGDRMKGYEREYNHKVPSKRFLVIRLDGKAFHTFTKGFKRPFDDKLNEAMVETTKYLCDNIQGAKFGYTQSDEITIIVSDLDKGETQMFYDGKIQKITSITASMATAKFNQVMSGNGVEKLAMFDSRVFAFEKEDVGEVVNAIIWRQQDAIKNSVSMVAQAAFSHKELHKKHQGDMKRMLREIGHPWSDYPIHFQRGTAVKRMETKVEIPSGPYKGGIVTRNKFTVDREMPVVTEDKNYVLDALDLDKMKK